MFPIHVLGGEFGEVGLRGARVPHQLIIGAALRILLTRDDGFMLALRDGALLFVVHLRPLAAGNDWFREPIHREGEIVQAAQIVVG